MGQKTKAMHYLYSEYWVSFNSMIKKIYKICFWLFFTESTLIIIGISAGVISYGKDIATPIMQIGIIIGLIIGGLFRILIRDLNSRTKEIVASILSMMYVFLCFYYLLEDQFKLTLH